MCIRNISIISYDYRVFTDLSACFFVRNSIVSFIENKRNGTTAYGFLASLGCAVRG